MKHLIFRGLFFAFVGIIITSCQKEVPEENIGTLSQTSSLATKELNQKEFKYNYEVTIYGNKKQCYVKYIIQSNDYDNAVSMFASLENSSIKMLNDKNSCKYMNNNSETDGRTDYKEVPYDDEKAVHLVEVERNIGEYKGYEVDLPEVTQRTYVNSFSSITIQATAGGIYVKNLWVYPNYNYHYYSDGTPGWKFDRMRTLSYYQDDTFTGGGYTAHLMIINPSYISGLFQYNNRIYWSVWP